MGLALVFALCLPAMGCEDPPADDALIEKTIRDGAKAIEDNRISDAADVLAENYLDAGKRDRVTLKRLAVMMRRQGPVALFLRDFKIEIDGVTARTVSDGASPNGTKAAVTLTVFALQGQKRLKSAADLIPKGARRHEIKLEMVKRSDEWLVTSMEGDRMRASGF